MVFVVLLRYFTCVGVIHKSETNLINRRYQIMVFNMLKKNYRYSNHYFIKFVSFMSIYYTINLDIFSLCMVFNYLYLESIDLL